MRIQDTIRQPRTLFSKEIHRIEITEVGPKDGEALFRKLYYLRLVYGGRDARLEIRIDGQNGFQLSMGDAWETEKDRRHYLKGFALAMFLHGVDLEDEYPGLFIFH